MARLEDLQQGAHVRGLDRSGVATVEVVSWVGEQAVKVICRSASGAAGRRTSLTFRDMDFELREACGWNYRTTQADITVNKYRNWYVTQLDGRELEIREHIGRGDKKSLGTKSIRIAFCWDAVTSRIVIGFIGQHQKNDQS